MLGKFGTHTTVTAGFWPWRELFFLAKDVTPVQVGPISLDSGARNLFYRRFMLDSSTPQQNRRLNISISDSKPLVDDFGGN